MKKTSPKKSLVLAKLLANPHVLKNLKSPRIYRKLTEKPVTWAIFNNPLIYVVITSGIILLFTYTTGLRLYENTKELARIKEARGQVLSEIEYWEETTKKYTGYRDGYFTLAVLEYRVGNEGKARMYLDKTLELDPNFAKGREFLKQIE